MTASALNTENEFLSPAEMYRLTGSKRALGQASWLIGQRIPHFVDGKRLIVSRVHVRQRLEGRTVVHSTGLNISAIK